MTKGDLIVWTIVASVPVHVVGCWVLAFLYYRARRQVRCLHYCYVNMSDWALERLELTHDDLKLSGIEKFYLKDIRGQWKVEADRHKAMIRRARVSVPAMNHVFYAHEDLELERNA